MVLSNSSMQPALQPLSEHERLDYLTIEPLLPRSVQPASVDLHLDNKILVELDKWQLVTPGVTTPYYRHVNIIVQPYILEPGEFILGSTLEKIGLNNLIAGMVTGKSSLARIGLTVAPGFIDPGFQGNITLEIFNASNNRIRLTHKMGITQLITYILADPATKIYGDEELGSKYQNQDGVTISKKDLPTKPNDNS